MTAIPENPSKVQYTPPPKKPTETLTTQTQANPAINQGNGTLTDFLAAVDNPLLRNLINITDASATTSSTTSTVGRPSDEAWLGPKIKRSGNADPAAQEYAQTRLTDILGTVGGNIQASMNNIATLAENLPKDASQLSAKLLEEMENVLKNLSIGDTARSINRLVVDKLSGVDEKAS